VSVYGLIFLTRFEFLRSLCSFGGDDLRGRGRAPVLMEDGNKKCHFVSATINYFSIRPP
jgi:hypothetical protein